MNLHRQKFNAIISGIIHGIALFVNSNYLWRFYVICSAIYQFIAFYVEYRMVNSLWLSTRLQEKYKEKTRLELETLDFASIGAGNFKSIVHAILSSTGSIVLMLQNSMIHEDHIYGFTPLASLLSVHSAGFFTTDLIDMLLYVKPFKFQDYVYLVHHAIGIVGFGIAGKFGLFTYYCSAVLLFELSTPFIGMRWWLIQWGHGSTKIFKIIELGFVVAFILVRIVWGLFWFLPGVARDLVPVITGGVDPAKHMHYREGFDQTLGHTSAFCLCLVLLSALINLIFLTKIIQMLQRSLGRKRGDTKKQD